MTTPTTPDVRAEALAVVAYLVTGLVRGEPSICFEDERGDYGDEDHTPVFDALVRLSDAESALKARDAEIERLRGDAEWRPIESAPKGRKLIVGYFNKLGKWRTVMGRYYLPKTLVNENDNFDLDEDDDGYAPEGWYEESESQSSILPTDEPPTHWKPLSEAPGAAIDQARATGGETAK